MKEEIPISVATNEVELTQKVIELVRQYLSDFQMRDLISKQFGEGAAIDELIVGKGRYENIDANICGVLVLTKSNAGAVRVIGMDQDENVETGPHMLSRYYIITVKDGQSCAVLGRPSFRPIRRPKA